ncbi:MAG: beta-N-acetylhexosaminidase [Cytophagales bacterium]|nr:beta-N-acetylhexosaminidase [Cytophagales bacterium]
MNKGFRLLMIAAMLSSALSCTTHECPEQPIEIIPYPNQLVTKEGCVDLSRGCRILGETEHGRYLYEKLGDLGIAKGKGAKIEFKPADQPNNLGEEGYQLIARKKVITIAANGKKGQFYGIQTLLQLVNGTTVAAVEIEDVPTFGWRAYMLDESRYFHGEEFVKQVLDQMAMLKMNTFHWHLTDDAGWRIEIKKYPLLAEVGGSRSDSEIDGWGSGKTSGEPHSGFYTQKQIKDIVAYAADRNITVVPEFEMPGHSSAAIAAYTWLGTAGKDIDVPVKFGRHYDNYDVTNPKVEQFVKDVLNELFELFPSDVIHIGGDEVGYKVWEDSEHVQEYMRENGLETPADLQIAFTNKISKYIESKGRRMMGWNEIMGINVHKGFEEKKDDKDAKTELAKNVVVHFWKGDIQLITEAAQKGYSIVNSLHTNTYLDYDYKYINLEKAYGFNPIPEDLNEKYHKNILGLGCQMWSEWTPTNKDVERQTFPRIAAYAEAAWTARDNKDYSRFRKSMDKITMIWDELGISFGPLDTEE